MARNEFGGDRPQERTIGMNTQAGANLGVDVHGDDLGFFALAIWNTSGVIPSEGGNLTVTATATASRRVQIDTGGAIYKSASGRTIGYRVSEPFTIPIDPNPSAVDRTDLVIVRYRYSATSALATLEVVNGTPGAGVPSIPYTSETDNAHAVAQILAPPGSGNISAANIQNFATRFARQKAASVEASEAAAILQYTTLPDFAVEGTVAALVSPIPSFEIGTSQFYGMQRHGDWLYVCAEFNVFTVNINLVKRFNVETGAEDVGFSFGIENIGDLSGSSTSGATTPSGLAANDNRVYLSRPTTSGTTIFAFDHSGNRIQGEDIAYRSDLNTVSGIWANSDNLYVLSTVAGSGFQRVNRMALDGSSQVQFSRNLTTTGGISGLAVDLPNNVAFAVRRGNSGRFIQRIPIGSASSPAATQLADLPSDFEGRAIALIDTVIFVGSETGASRSISTSGAEGLYIRRGGAWVTYG